MTYFIADALFIFSGIAFGIGILVLTIRMDFVRHYLKGEKGDTGPMGPVGPPGDYCETIEDSPIGDVKILRSYFLNNPHTSFVDPEEPEGD